MKVRDRDILIPTMMTGNVQNPRWYDESTIPKGRFLMDSKEKEAFDHAILALVHDQEKAGLDIISDGRVYSGSSYAQIVYYFYDRIKNVDAFNGPLLGIPIYSMLWAPTLTGPLERKCSWTRFIAESCREATDKPLKIQYEGVQVMIQALNDLYYSSVLERAKAMAKIMNEDFKELDELGVEYIQLDEFTWPYVMEDWAVDAFNAAVDGVQAKILTHVCFGNYRGTPGYFPDETERDWHSYYQLQLRKGEAPKGAWSVLPRAYEAKMDVLNIEFGRLGTGFYEAFKVYPPPANLDICLGVIDVKSTICETAEEVAGRIRQALQYVPAERLCVSTDCGLFLLQPYVAIEKLKALAAGTKLVREELAAKTAAPAGATA